MDEIERLKGDSMPRSFSQKIKLLALLRIFHDQDPAHLKNTSMFTGYKTAVSFLCPSCVLPYETDR